MTLRPLLKIDPKDKGKKKIEEEDETDSESDDIPQAEKKFKQLETIRPGIRIRPPTKNQLRNQIMTYLKHVGNFKHAELKIKKFEEVQALYEKIKRSDEDFIFIGSVEDERLLKRMNEKGIDSSKDQMVKEESKEEVKKESKEEVQEEGKEEERFDRVLWGDLMVMFNPDDENEFWNSQQDWNIVSWKLHGSSGVHTLVTEAGLVIHMLIEKKYPLRKDVLMQMLKLKLESEKDSTMALE
ncbi:hypothetical protein Tco_1568549 [Tanacetum coccineum]